MDMVTLLWSVFFRSIGLGDFIYGKKQFHAVARYNGITDSLSLLHPEYDGLSGRRIYAIATTKIFKTVRTNSETINNRLTNSRQALKPIK
jgi:hypothetical protein